METPETQKNSPMLSKKTVIVVVAVVILTIAAYFMQSTNFFKASILDLSGVPAFDGTTPPLKKTLKWTALTSTKFAEFKSGTLTAENAGDLLIDIMPYDANLYCNTNPANLAWTGDDLNKRNSFLTYVTEFSAAYTSGSKQSCEGTGSHPAVDIRAAKGTPVYAIANGLIVKRTDGHASNGNMLCLTHPQVPSLDDENTKVNYTSCYLHMGALAADMAVGTVVLKGTQIGMVDTTGTSTTYHLHFQLDKDNAPFHPYWPFTSAQATAAGLDFFSGVNNGLNKENVATYTVNSMGWVQKYLNYNQTATAGTTTNPPPANANTAPPANANTTAPANVNAAPPVTNTNSAPLVTNENANVAVLNTNTNTTSAANTNSTVATNGSVFFSDVSASHVNFAAIKYLKENDIVGGNPDGTFLPNDTINRAALTKIIVEAKFKGQATGGNCFPDVTDEWFAPYVCFAKERGIVGGYPDGTFQPNNPVKFVEAAKIISVGFSYTSADSPTIPWYKLFVDTLSSKSAIPTTVIEFEENITRGEMSEMIYRLLNNITNLDSQSFASLGGIS